MVSQFNFQKFEEALQNGEFKYLELLTSNNSIWIFRLKIKCNSGGYGLEINRITLRGEWFYYFNGHNPACNPINAMRYSIRFEELLNNLSNIPEVQTELLFHLDLFKSI